LINISILWVTFWVLAGLTYKEPIKPCHAQVITIDSTFTSDAEIYPFSQNDTIYGLSITGEISLLSDTSLVRVILVDADSNEYMAYEAYPLIVTDTSLTITDECDETCYLNEFIPVSIKIHIIEGTFYFESCDYSQEYLENLEILQFQSKRNKDTEKIQNMHQYIQSNGWNWYADSTKFVKQYYFQKRDFFGEKYNLLGIEYYVSGIYNNVLLELIPPSEDLTLIQAFDWREKHDAHIPYTHYWDGDLDNDEQGNGWMTGIRDQNNCKSCAAFGSISSLEALINIYFNYHFDSTEGFRFSEKDAFNCTRYSAGMVGCDCNEAKELITILNYLKDPGVVNEECFKYPDPDYEFCEGIWPDCSYSSKCTTGYITAKISNRITINLAHPPAGMSKQEYLKTMLIENGPLTITVYKLFSSTMPHAVTLVGYDKDEIANQTVWIMKNSWGLDNSNYQFPPGVIAADGYVIAPLSLDPDPNTYSIFNSVYAFEEPVINSPFVDYYVHKYDKDQDGYWNWGLEMPEGWNPPYNTR
jgi:hypothetical protein